MVTISKFFAELGFKVNSSEFKQVESTLKQINNAYKQLSQEVKLQGLELKNKLTQQKINTEAEKTAIQASKAQKAAIDTETAAIRKQTAELNLQNKQNRTRLGLLSKLMPYISAYAIGAGFSSTAKEGLRYRDFQRQTGMDVEGLQKYEAASQMVGSSLSSEQVTSEIKELQQRMQAIQYAQGDVTPFQVWGLQTQGNTAYDIIEGLRERIKGLDDASALYWVRQIGLSDDWLHILRQSKEEFDSLQAAMLSKEQIKNVSNLGMAFRRAQFALKQLRDQFVAFLSGVMSTAISNFSRMATELASFIKSMSESREAFAIFAAGIGMIMLAIAPLTTMLIGLLLVLEDMWVASKGGESFFDWDADSFTIFKNTIVEGLREIIDMAKATAKWMNDLSNFSILGWKPFKSDDDNQEEEKTEKKSVIRKSVKDVFDSLGEVGNFFSRLSGNDKLTSTDNLTKTIKQQTVTVNAPRNVNATVNVNSPEDAEIVVRELETEDMPEIREYNRTHFAIDGSY